MHRRPTSPEIRPGTFPYRARIFIMKLHVGNLSFQTTEDQLRSMFAPYGELRSVALGMNRETGQSRGFGFVEIDDAAHAQAALDGLNGTAIDGRTITVGPARTKEERDSARNTVTSVTDSPVAGIAAV
jgi:RNA recognition motif-containing protein